MTACIWRIATILLIAKFDLAWSADTGWTTPVCKLRTDLPAGIWPRKLRNRCHCFVAASGIAALIHRSFNVSC